MIRIRWFEDIISFEEIKTKRTTDKILPKNTLIEILHQASIQNPSFWIKKVTILKPI